MSRKGEQMTRTERRKLVAVNILNGMTYRQIAEALGIGVTTVSRDVEALKKQWQAEHVHRINELIGVESARLDAALLAIMPKVRQGNLYAIDRMLAILDRRIKLYGLDSKALLEHVKELLTRDGDGKRPASIAQGIRELEALLDTGGGAEGAGTPDEDVPTLN